MDLWDIVLHSAFCFKNDCMKVLIHLFAVAFFLFFEIKNAAAQLFHHKESETNLAQIRNTNGIAAADIDRDGDLDLFFTGIKNFEINDPTTWNHLMKNTGDGTFSEATFEAGLGVQYVNDGLPAARGEKMGASFGDYDNDGFPDLFLANSRENQLFHNNGNGTFTDVTEAAGVAGCNVCYSSTGLWWDHDRDGDLDLYVSNLNNENVMYENLGNGKFADVTQNLGLGGGLTITWMSVAFDAGKDGYLDLLNVNDTQHKAFFENRSGQKYNETALAYRINSTGADMGATIGDPNGDGLFDIYTTSIFNYEPNKLFIATGPRRFEDQAEKWGVDDTGWGWGTELFDFDHDGDEDLAAVNGPIDEVHHAIQPDIGNFFFKNLLKEGETRFEDISAASGTDGFAKSKGLEVFDFDQDGDLDMAVANMDSAAYFFENQLLQKNVPVASDKNWLQIRLEGTVSNRSAFGTTVKIRVGDRWTYRYFHGATVFGQNVLPVHFGTSTAAVIDEIRFTWLTGKTEAIYNVAANQIIDFKEGSGTPVIETIDEGPTTGAIVEKTWAEPNPFLEKTELHFKLSGTGDVNLQIFNTLGQLVYAQKQVLSEPGELQFDWNAQAVAAGVYFYKAYFGGKKMEGRLVKGF